MSTTTAPPAGQQAGTPDFESLRRAVSGALTTPDDAGFAAARMPWLVNVEQHPAAVLAVADVADVVAAVRWAATNGTPVSVQPTGHAPRAALDGTLLLRTRALQGIQVDEVRRTVAVGAGVKWGELLEVLDGTGLIGLCGSNPDVSVVGLTLGGGVSWFTRLWGFTSDTVVSFDVVTPDGELVRVTASSDPDLFWALRGGGGDFGVVVSAELALFDAPEMYGGQLLWPIEHAPAVLRAFRGLAVSAPRELAVWAHLQHFPPIPDVPEPLRGRSFVRVATVYVGSADAARHLLAPLMTSAPVEMDLLGPVTPAGLAAVAAEPTEPMPGIEASRLLDGLDDTAIDALCATAGDPHTTPLMLVQLRGLGGAFADEPAVPSAVRRVTEPFQLFALGVPMVPELAEAIPHGIAAVEGAVAHLTSGHRMPNFVPVGGSDAGGYDAGRLERLRRIKAERDPRGVIRSNKPVAAS
jgi:FAD/FMN-containing dehydrogenase